MSKKIIVDFTVEIDKLKQKILQYYNQYLEFEKNEKNDQKIKEI